MIRTVDLMREIIAAQAHPTAGALLRPLGLDPEVSSVIGVAKVRPDGDGLYVPDVDGAVTAAIVPLMPDDELIDLVAVDIARPDRWRRRTGLGDLLGENNVFGLFDEPLLVHPSPTEWLRSDCEGVAILEFTPTVRGLLNSLEGGLEAVGDPDFAQSLERALTVPERRPRIFVRERKAA